MSKIRSAMPIKECEVQLVANGPEDRGDVGRLRVRDGQGLRWVWLLRCPWCRELVEIEKRRVYVLRGEIWIRGGPVVCPNCSQQTEIARGVGRQHRNGGS